MLENYKIILKLYGIILFFLIPLFTATGESTAIVLPEPGYIEYGLVERNTDPNPVTTPSPALLCGDVNSDGQTDIADALLTVQCFVGLIPCPETAIDVSQATHDFIFDPEKADVDCNKVLDIRDALLIAQFYAGLIDIFPCYEPAKQDDETKSISDSRKIGIITVPKSADGAATGHIIVKFTSEVADSIDQQIDEGTTIDKLKVDESLQKLIKQYNIKNLNKLLKNYDKIVERIAEIKDKAEQGKILNKVEEKIHRKLEMVPENVVVPDLSAIYQIMVDLEEGQAIKNAVRDFKSNEFIEYAEPDYVYQISSTIPNDPYFTVAHNAYQWALLNNGQPFPPQGMTGTVDKDIDTDEAWDITTGSDEVIVAVIDTGIDYNHRDIINNMWINDAEVLNGHDDDGNGYKDDIYGYDFYYGNYDPFDYMGHGTHCAGIIAAEGNNDQDIAGISWHSKVMAIKVGDATGNLFISKVIEGIIYAIDNGADILSNSYGGTKFSRVLQDTINYAYSQGVIFIAAAGNNNNSTPFYPAAYDNVLAVAATDPDDNKAGFSNFGDWVDVTAPGVSILSLKSFEIDFGTPFGDVEYLTVASGTSMAAPHVSGVCALLLSFNPTLTVDQLTEIIKETGDPVADGICNSDKRINANNALLSSLNTKGRITLDKNTYICCDCLPESPPGNGSIPWLEKFNLPDNTEVDFGKTDNISITDGSGVERKPNTIIITVYDTNINGPSVDIELFTVSLDREYVTLNPVPGFNGVFSGTIYTADNPVLMDDGKLQVAHNNKIYAYYHDNDDGTGEPYTASDTATADCVPTDIQNIDWEPLPLGPDVNISVTTNEAAKVIIRYGTIQGYPFQYENSRYGSSVKIHLNQVNPGTTYYFQVEAIDDAGNMTIDDNSGQYYSFTTSEYDSQILVYAKNYSWVDYTSIQDAIDAAWDGAIVTVFPGQYNGQIDFKGKKITVRSAVPTDWDYISNTIIYFDNSMAGPEPWDMFGVRMMARESRESIFTGFTIECNNVQGAICCVGSKPTISNCLFKTNFAGYGVYAIGGSPEIKNSIIEGSYFWGIYSIISKIDIRDCRFEGGLNGIELNSKTKAGVIENNVIYDYTCSGISLNGPKTMPVRNNIIYNNQVGIKLTYYDMDGSITGNTIVNNTDAGLYVGDRMNNGVTLDIHSCIFWNNLDDISYKDPQSNPLAISYSCIEDNDNGIGVIHSNPQFIDINNDNYHIQTGSPCYNAGDPGYVVEDGEVDMDGQDRIQDGCIEIGADEL